MRISKYIIIGLSLFVASYGISAQADEKPLVIGGLIVPPHIMETSDGKPVGLIIDQINLVSNITGIEVQYRLNNWARSFDDIKRHRIDALIPTMYSEDRAEFLHFPKTPVALWKSSLFKKRGSDASFSGNIEDLYKYNIGRIRNARVSPAFDLAVNEGMLHVDEKNSAALLMRSLSLGRIDFAAIGLYVGAWSAQQEGVWQEVEPVKPILGAMPVYLAFSKQNVNIELVEYFDKVLMELQANGSLGEIRHKYIN